MYLLPRKESSSALPLALLKRTVGTTGRGARAALPNESARLNEPPEYEEKIGYFKF